MQHLPRSLPGCCLRPHRCRWAPKDRQASSRDREPEGASATAGAWRHATSCMSVFTRSNGAPSSGGMSKFRGASSSGHSLGRLSPWLMRFAENCLASRARKWCAAPGTLHDSVDLVSKVLRVGDAVTFFLLASIAFTSAHSLSKSIVFTFSRRLSASRGAAQNL